MILYHYTAHEYWPHIQVQGLTRGDVPFDAHTAGNAVWLTQDRDPSGHGLTDGRPLTPADAQFFGVQWHERLRFPNKRAIRLTVRIPRGDRNLVMWARWARRLDPRWRQTMEETGGGRGKAATWFLYWGTIPPAWITAKDDLASAVDVGERDPHSEPAS